MPTITLLNTSATAGIFVKPVKVTRQLGNGFIPLNGFDVMFGFDWLMRLTLFGSLLVYAERNARYKHVLRIATIA